LITSGGAGGVVSGAVAEGTAEGVDEGVAGGVDEGVAEGEVEGVVDAGGVVPVLPAQAKSERASANVRITTKTFFILFSPFLCQNFILWLKTAINLTVS